MTKTANSPANGGDGGTSGQQGELTAEAIQRFIQQQAGGDTLRAVERLLRDNRKYRRRIGGDPSIKIDGVDTALREDLADAQRTIQFLEQHQIPAGHVAVKKEDADALPLYREIHKDPAELKKLITDELPKLRDRVSDFDRLTLMEKAAKPFGWKATVLTRLAKRENFEVEMRDVEIDEEDGDEPKTEKRPFARVAGDDKASWIPLDKFFEKNDELRDYIPSLRASESENGSSTSTTSTSGDATSGVEIPRQRTSTGRAPKNDVVSGYGGRTFVPPSKRNAAADDKK